MTSIALITGTSSGIGLALTRQLLERGWEVAGLSRRPAPIEHVRYRHAQVDLSKFLELPAMLAQHLDSLLREPGWATVALVNNAAAAGGFGGIESVSAEEVRTTLTVDALAPIWLMGHVAGLVPAETPLRIVNVSSGAARQAFPGLALYCASKAALRIAGQTLAAEWESAERPGGPRRNGAILSYEPGIVDTEIQTYARTRPKSEFPWVGMFLDFEAEGRLVAPQQVTGEIVAFLEDPRAHGFSEERFGGQAGRSVATDRPPPRSADPERST